MIVEKNRKETKNVYLCFIDYRKAFDTVVHEILSHCILSPHLFNIYAGAIMREALDNFEGTITIGGRTVDNTRYADDVVLVAGLWLPICSNIQTLNTFNSIPKYVQ